MNCKALSFLMPETGEIPSCLPSGKSGTYILKNHSIPILLIYNFYIIHGRIDAITNKAERRIFMIYKQVQQSTYLLDYAGQRFLVDPIMGGLEKGAAKEEIKFSDLLDVDAVIATHLTKGAFDGEARRLIPRGMKVFVQNEADADSLSMDGFSNLEILTETTEFCHLSIRKTPAFYKVNGISTMDRKAAAC